MSVPYLRNRATASTVIRPRPLLRSRVYGYAGNFRCRLLACLMGLAVLSSTTWATEPVAPTQPPEPAQAVEPLLPVEPTQPASPRQPTQQTHPLRPTKPVRTIRSVDGRSPAGDNMRQFFGSSGELLFGETGNWQPAVMLDSHFDLDIQGLVAEVTLSQKFRNSDAHWKEAIYRFPMHEEAAIRALDMRIDDRVVKGMVVEKQEAREQFAQARASGKIASVVEQSRPNLFTARVANIAPHAEIQIEISVVIPIDVVGQHAQVVLPSTVTPRYVNELTSDPADVLSTIVQVDDSNDQSLPFVTLSGSVHPVPVHSTIESSSHTLNLRSNTFQIARTPMDRDIHIRWPWVSEGDADITAFSSADPTGRYVQLLVRPPLLEQTDIPARELTLVADKSGSMAGTSIVAVREALHAALDALRPQDTFNIISFDDDSYPLFQQPVTADSAALAAARRFIDNMQADGGTEMMRALRLAMNARASDEQRVQQIVFLTDGSVGYEKDIIASIAASIGNKRLFPVGIGSAPNRWFLDQAAIEGGGIALSIADASQAEATLKELLDELSRPSLTNLTLQWEGGRAVVHPKRIPDVYSDNPLMLLAKVPESVETVTATATYQGGVWQRHLNLANSMKTSPGEAGAEMTPMGILWNRFAMRSLLAEQRLSHDPELNKQAITDMALRAGLVSPYTSYIAVEQVASRPANTALRLEEVANRMPMGNQMNSIYVPQGSAGTDTLLLIALLAALAGAGLLFISRRLDGAATSVEATA